MSVVVHTRVGAGSLPTPDDSLVSTSDDNVSDGRAFAGHDDNGDLGGGGIKRTVTIGTGRAGAGRQRQGRRRRDRHRAGQPMNQEPNMSDSTDEQHGEH